MLMHIQCHVPRYLCVIFDINYHHYMRISISLDTAYPKLRPYKQARGMCIVLTYSYGKFNCDRLHIVIAFIYISTPLLTSTHKPVLARTHSSLEEGITGKILKFADYTKLFRKNKEIGDKLNLQDGIDNLVKWSEKWQMLFNYGKSKCLHTGPGNTSMNYEMGGTILSKTVKEKDLGVTMNANIKVSEQCRIAASKGNQVLGIIRRNITYKDKRVIVPLYKIIVRPHLEYCIQGWSPCLRKYIYMFEKIQRRATKLIPGLRDLRYEEGLKEYGLTTLETRRLRGGTKYKCLRY